MILRRGSCCFKDRAVILNVSEASLHLGFKSRTPLQRLLRDGHLDGYRAGDRGREVLLESAPPGLPSLRERVRGLTQYRAGSPLWEVPQSAAPGLDWPALAAKVNAYLGPDWPAPPWSGDQLNTVAMVLALAGDE